MTKIFFVAFCFLAILSCGCKEVKQSSDQVQQEQQEQILEEANRQTGMPAIKNFRERKLVKELLELRDQDGLTTWTYLYSPQLGKLLLLGQSIGYGIPYATQYTNPQKVSWGKYSSGSWYRDIMPQADPNGLFSPSSAEGTFVFLVDPKGGAARPVYIEERVLVSPFPLSLGMTPEAVR